MLWSPQLTRLRNRLASLFPNKDEARRIVDQAQLNPAYINFDNKAINDWHNILDQAILHDKIEAIVQAALEEFENDTELCTAYDAYMRSIGRNFMVSSGQEQITKKLGIPVSRREEKEYEEIIQEYLDYLSKEYNRSSRTIIYDNQGVGHELYVAPRLTTYRAKDSGNSQIQKNTDEQPNLAIPRDTDHKSLSHLAGEAGVESVEVELSLNDLLNSSDKKFSVISGRLGAGKSVLMRQIAMTYIRNLSPEQVSHPNHTDLGLGIDRSRLPITINCSLLNQYNSLGSARLVENATRLLLTSSQRQMEKIIQDAIRSGAAILLIDDLDQLNRSNALQELEESIRGLVEGRDIPVLITTSYKRFLNSWDVANVSLNQFSDKGRDEYLERFFNLSKGSRGIPNDKDFATFIKPIQGKSWNKDPFFLWVACQIGFKENIEHEKDLIPKFFDFAYKEYKKRLQARPKLEIDKSTVLKSLGILAYTIHANHVESINHDNACGALRELSLGNQPSEHALLTVLTEEFSLFIQHLPHGSSTTRF